MSSPAPPGEPGAPPDDSSIDRAPAEAPWRHPVWGALGKAYGARYNVGEEVGFTDADRRGYPGPGHWYNEERWYASAMGVRDAAQAILRRRVGRVLDLGCGRGQMVRFLRVLGVRAYGADLGVDDIRPPYCVGGNAVAVPFLAGAFDVVAALDIIEHVPSDLQAPLHAEIQRLGAALVLATVPTREPRFVLASDAGPRNHYLTVSPADWRAHLERHGWRIVAEGSALARWGNPFDHGLDNYPFALAPAGESR